MMRKLLPASLSAALLMPTLATAEDAMVVQVQRLHADVAVQIAQAAVTACRAKGIQIAATVVDRDGTVQAVMRDTIASPLTLDVSRQKAYTAANFNADLGTPAMAERANGPIGRAPNITMSAGGLPIQIGGALLGAVGVSGAPSGVTDAECAQAGIDAVKDDLEMSM
jgi:uncharacterized protein GlcG (DUF336 family)